MMLATSVVVSVGLGGGFGRSARAARLPDVIARFDDQPAARVAARVAALPDVETFTTRLEFTNIPLATAGHFSDTRRARGDRSRTAGLRDRRRAGPRAGGR